MNERNSFKMNNAKATVTAAAAKSMDESAVSAGALGGGDLFEKHTPLYPLPMEILKMKKDETVCQFCGVSYLIHNEIKKLEERIKDLELKLRDYESLKQREKEFKQISDEATLKIQDLDEKLSMRIQMISSLNNDLDSRDIEISRLKKIINENNDEKTLTNVNNQKLRNKLLLYESNAKETLVSLASTKSELKAVELAAKSQISQMNQTISNLKLQMDAYVNRLNREQGDKSGEIEQLRFQLNGSLRNYNQSKETIEHLTKQIEAFDRIKAELNSQINILNDELEKSRKSDSKLIGMEKERMKLMQENSELRSELDAQKHKQSTKLIEHSELKSRIDSCQEKMNLQKQVYEQELRGKTEEIRKLKIELDSFKRRSEEREKFEKDLLSNHESNLNEINTLKSEIRKLTDTISEMQQERKAITIAHQCQMSQLKESFKERMKINDDLPEKLANELNKEREKHNLEIKRLEENLKENFRIDFEIQQQKYNEMYAKYQQISKDYEANSRSRINDLEAEKQRLISELKYLHEDKLTSEKKSRSEIDNLKDVAKELHERLTQKEAVTAGDDESDMKRLKLKEQLIEKTNRVGELEMKIKQLERQLNDTHEEVKILQETVHKECLERDELLEKLEDTRKELILLRKENFSVQISQQVIPLPPNKHIIDKKQQQQQQKQKSSISYPKNLNEMMNSGRGHMGGGDGGSSRRSSFNLGGSHRETRASSEKSNPDSVAVAVNNYNATTNNNNNNNNRRIMNALNASKTVSSLLAAAAASSHNNGSGNNQTITEPIQLFRKINELAAANANNNKINNKPSASTSSIDNKRRISLLLARKT